MSEVQNFELAEQEQIQHLQDVGGEKYYYDQSIWFVRLNQLANLQSYIKKFGITKEKKDLYLSTISIHEYTKTKKITDYTEMKEFLNDLDL